MKPQAIIIEAGHGGKNGLETDPGAMANGIVEREFTVDIARRIHRILSSKDELAGCFIHGMGIDRGIWFADKIEEANIMTKRLDPTRCFYFSIHGNAASSKSASGVEIYAKDRKKGISPTPYDIAEFIGHSLSLYFPGWKPRNPLIRPATGSNAKGINQIWAHSLLIECGFMTNNQDAVIMSTERARLSECIAHGILQYFRNLL